MIKSNNKLGLLIALLCLLGMVLLTMSVEKTSVKPQSANAVDSFEVKSRPEWTGEPVNSKVTWKGEIEWSLESGDALLIRKIPTDNDFPFFIAQFPLNNAHERFNGFVEIKGTFLGIDCEAYSRTLLNGKCAPQISIGGIKNL